jgi:hypothetical protein
MHNKFMSGLWFLLIPLTLCTSGCWWGGGGTFHHPLPTVHRGEPWVVKVQYSTDPRDWRWSLSEKCKNFTAHFRDSQSEDFLAVPMVIVSMEPKIGRAELEAKMPAVPCDAGIEYVEYYYDNITPNYVYNRTKVFRIPVSR